MTGSKKKRRKTKPYQPSLTEAQYNRYFLALEEGEVNHENQNVYWDLGPGERPERVMADMRYVARKAEIPVKISKGKGNFLILHYQKSSAPASISVRRGSKTVFESQ